MLEMVAAARFSDFYRGLYPRVYRFVYSQTDAAPTDVEDLVQETLLHAWEGREAFAGRSEPETWVLSIARHKVADFWRRRDRSEAYAAEAVRDALARIDRDPVPEALLETAEMRRRVAGALEALDEPYARVLTLRYLEGLSVRAVAETLGETETAVESRLARARQAFRKLLGGDRD
jgi:RNA polymerase sigma-70 factor (ECF subfamily)